MSIRNVGLRLIIQVCVRGMLLTLHVVGVCYWVTFDQSYLFILSWNHGSGNHSQLACHDIQWYDS